MKEIKAYIRLEKIDDAVHALEAIGLQDMTIIDVSALGSFCDLEQFKYSVEFVERYSKMAKLEIVVDDTLVDSIATLIMRHAHTGLPGDGIIFISPVLKTYRFREMHPVFQLKNDLGHT